MSPSFLITKLVQLGKMKQGTPWAQSTIINKEIEDVKDSITDSIELSKSFYAKFLRLSDKAEKKLRASVKGNCIELLSKGIVLKRKFKEKLYEATNLERYYRYFKRTEKKIIYRKIIT